MELALLVWLAGVSQSIGNAFSFMGWIASALSICGYGLWIIFSKNDKSFPEPPKKRYAIPVIALSVMVWVVGLLMPDQKTVYMATGAYLGQKVIQSETADKVVKILDVKLDEYLKEAEDKLSSKEKK